MPDRSHILLGFYSGIGDYLAAAPVINELARKGNRLTIVATQTIQELSRTLKWESDGIEWIEFEPFSITAPWKALNLFHRLAKVRPDLAIVSPHAPSAVSSWKLPLFLRLLQIVGWSGCQTMGNIDERGARFFDRVAGIDRTAPLSHREWSLHVALGTIESDRRPPSVQFKLPAHMGPMPMVDLAIHPGASRKTKRWPLKHYRLLLETLGSHVRVRFVGLNSELGPIRAMMNECDNIEFFAGSIAESIMAMSRAEAILTMDSGFSHIAANLGRPHLALFGSTDPGAYAPVSPTSTALYQPALDCQPCHKATCSIGNTPCMSLLNPEAVAERVEKILSKANATASEA